MRYANARDFTSPEAALLELRRIMNEAGITKKQILDMFEKTRKKVTIQPRSHLSAPACRGSDLSACGTHRQAKTQRKPLCLYALVATEQLRNFL